MRLPLSLGQKGQGIATRRPLLIAVTAVTSLGGPTNVASASATPTAAASSGGIHSSAKVIIQIVAGVAGSIILIIVLWRIIRLWMRRRPAPPPPNNIYPSAPAAKKPYETTSSIPLSPYAHPVDIEDDRTSRWVYNRNDGGAIEDRQTVTSEAFSDPTHAGDYSMDRLRRPTPTLGRF